MRRSNLSLALSLLLVFGSGIAVGVFGRGYFDSTTAKANVARPQTPDDYRKVYLEEMSSGGRPPYDPVSTPRGTLPESGLAAGRGRATTAPLSSLRSGLRLRPTARQ